MKLPAIYPIYNFTDEKQDLSLLFKLITLNSKIVQIRSKIDMISTREVIKKSLEFKKEVRSISKIIVNDYVDLALICNADGVHLGQSDQDIPSARNLLGSQKIIGLSCHNMSDLKNAPINYLDYVALGPIFESKTKIGHAPTVGLETLSEFVKKSPLPVVAIGGIDQHNFKSILDTGAESCAMVSAIEVHTVENLLNQAQEHKAALSLTA